MLYDKRTKALFFEGKESVKEFLSINQIIKISRFLKVYFVKLLNYTSKTSELEEKFYMHFGNKALKTVFEGIGSKSLKELYLIIEIFAKEQKEIYNKYSPEKFNSFLQDINNLFLIEKIPLQVIYIEKNEDIFVEKIIDEVHSEKVKETLMQFNKYDKIQKDFKQAIVSYSSGDNKTAIEKSCIAIEDYLCVILGKGSCKSVKSYYSEASSKLKIPEDINSRFNSMINFIHDYRSKPLHGSKSEHDPENPHLIAQISIGFTMIILNYLHNIFEKNLNI